MLVSLLVTAVLGASLQVPAPDPVVWSDSGVSVADTEGRQRWSDMKSFSNQTFVAWQDDSGIDPDVVIQCVNALGERAFGAGGYRIDRQGSQVWPTLVRDGCVFFESTDHRGYGAQFLEWSGDSLRYTELSAPGGGVSDVQVARVGSTVIASWIRVADFRRSIDVAVMNRGEVHNFTICTHDQSVGDLQMVADNDLVFFAWTDWRDVYHPRVYGQVLDLETREALWPTDGMLLTPETHWALYPTLSGTAEPGYVALTFEERLSDERKIVRHQIIDYLGNFRFWPAVNVYGPHWEIAELTATRFGENTFIAWTTDDVLRTDMITWGGESVSVDWAGSFRDLRIRDVAVAASDSLAWLTWRDNEYGVGQEKVHVQQFSWDNRSFWREGGIDAADTGNAQLEPHLSVVSPTECVVGWSDYRNDPRVPQIYLQRYK